MSSLKEARIKVTGENKYSIRITDSPEEKVKIDKYVLLCKNFHSRIKELKDGECNFHIEIEKVY